MPAPTPANCFRIFLFSLVFSTALIQTVSAQDEVEAPPSNRQMGDEAYRLLDYTTAIRFYSLFLRDTADPIIMARVGDCYQRMEDYTSAEAWYKDAVRSGAPASVRKDYGNALRATGKYPQAKAEFREYGKLVEDDTAYASRMMHSCEFAMVTKWDTNQYYIQRFNFNTPGSDCSPTESEGLLYYTTTGPNGYDIYTRHVPIENDERPELLKGSVNSPFHDGPVTFTPDKKKMYFTRSNYTDMWLEWGTGDIHYLKIYSAEWDKNKWVNVQELPFNSDAYSTAHPALSPDGFEMVFASNRPGGEGGVDLWITTQTENGWTEPVNLGPKINTPGNEMFPFFHETGALLFSSDGHVGLGELDIFVSERSEKGFAEPVNMGFPLNSNKDDFSICWIYGSPSGFLASNRSGTAGSDDIYQFARMIPVELTLTSDITGQPLEGAKIFVTDTSGIAKEFTSGYLGKIKFFQPWGTVASIQAEAGGYKSQAMDYSTEGISTLAFPFTGMKMRSDQQFQLTVTAVDDADSKPLEGAEIHLMGERDTRMLPADAKGSAWFPLEKGSDYTVMVMQKGYIPEIYNLSTRGIEGEKMFNFDARLKKGSYLVLTGQTLDARNNEPVADVIVQPQDADFRPAGPDMVTRNDGKFWLVVTPGREMSVLAKKPGFFVARGELPNLEFLPKDTILTIGLVPLVEYKVGAIAKVIYYDVNEDKITPESARKLRALAVFLHDNPETIVQMNSHTDARGNDDFNLELSRKRAVSTVEFLKGCGIAGSRMRPVGRGEKFLVNECKNNVACSDEKHQQNRRTELEVIALDPKAAKTDLVPAAIPNPDGFGMMVESIQLPFREEKTTYAVHAGHYTDSIPSAVYLELGTWTEQLLVHKSGKDYNLYVGKFDSAVKANGLLETLLKAGLENAYLVTFPPAN